MSSFAALVAKKRKAKLDAEKEKEAKAAKLAHNEAEESAQGGSKVHCMAETQD